ncbi:hypothetical protein BST61_g5163 [Cercospora zeina]
MAPKLPEPWLAGLIQAEITAVIEWKQQRLDGIKSDPDSRFSDDGSNFRSEVVSPPSTAVVQLVEVLSSNDVVTAYISDGSWKVKARFSDEAVATFEEESGSPVTTEVSGDILRLEKFTVVSTPFGPPDGFVQLYVGDIEYHTLRRKILGVPHPVEDLYVIRTLIESTKSLRMPGPTSQDVLEHAQKDPRPRKAPSIVSNRSTAQTQPTTPTTKANRKLTSGKRKSPSPTLDKDGFELQSGVNLHGPVQAATHDMNGSSTGPAINPNLMKLLPPKEPAPSTVTTVKSAPQTQLTTAYTLKQALARDSPSRKVKNTGISEHRQRPMSPAGVLESPLRPGSGQESALQRDAPTNHSTTDAPSPNGMPPLPSQRNGKAAGTSPFVYARRKIPNDQRKLLDNPASWVPSLPGRQFPAPNVPMTLLLKWNEEADADAEAPSVSMPSADAPHQRPDSRSEALADSDSSSENSQGTAEEYTPSPSKNWEARQAVVPSATSVNSSIESDSSVGGHSRRHSHSPHHPNRRAIPPSSALGTVIRGTPQNEDELQIVPPRPLPYRKSPKKRSAEALSPPPAKRRSSLSLKATDSARGPSEFSVAKQTDKGLATLRTKRGTVGLSSPTQLDTVFGLPTHESARSLPSSQRHSAHETRPPVAQTPKSTAFATQPKSSQIPPSGPRSSVPHTYQSTQSLKVSASKPPMSSPKSITAHSDGQPYSWRSNAGSPSSVYRGYLNDTSRESPRQDEQTPNRANSKRVNDSLSERSSVRTSLGHRAPFSTTHAVSPEASPRQPQATSTLLHTGRKRDGTDINPVQSTRPPAVTLSARKAWLKANYMPSRSGEVHLPELLKLYQKAFPHDSTVAIDDLVSAARYAFDKDDITRSMRYQSKRAVSNNRSAMHDASDITRSLQSNVDRSEQPEGQQWMPSGSVYKKVSEMPHDHPAYRHRQARTQFFNEQRRKDYLSKHYAPSRTGTEGIDTVFERYRQACPEDNQLPHATPHG